MPKGPNGQKRPGDVIGAAIMVARIATGEVEEGVQPVSPATKEARAEAGRKGARARTTAIAPKRRSEIAKTAAQARWRKSETAKD